MKKQQIIDAWATIRKENNTIPDDVLDLMKDAAIEKIEIDSASMSMEESMQDPELLTNIVLSGYVRELAEGADYFSTTDKTAKIIAGLYQNKKDQPKRDCRMCGGKAL